MKKLTALVLAIVLAFTVNVFAADEPPCFYDASESDIFGIGLTGNNVPTTSNVILLPEQRGSFSYSFETKKVQYSDFVIVPTTSTTCINIGIVGEEQHYVTVKVMKNSQTIYSTEVIVDDSEVELYVPFYDLTVNGIYYVQLESSTKNGATGDVTVWGS